MTTQLLATKIADLILTTPDNIQIIVTHDSDAWFVSVDGHDEGMMFDSEAGAIDYAWYLSSNR